MGIQQLEKEYPVRVFETGPNGRITLHSLFNYMQDIAAGHAEILGYGRADLMKSNHFWVLSRMYAEFTESPAWNDRIIVKTWPSGTEKLFAMRTYELTSSNGRKIGAGTSSWLIIDWTTKKIRRPDEFLQRYSMENSTLVHPVRNPVKLDDQVTNGTEYGPFRVPVSDIDINLHTNNANYLKWVTDTYDLNFILDHQPISAEINYLAESVAGDRIIIRSARDMQNAGFFNHIIIRESDGRELCRLRIGWEKLSHNRL